MLDPRCTTFILSVDDLETRAVKNLLESPDADGLSFEVIDLEIGWGGLPRALKTHVRCARPSCWSS